MDEAHHSPKKPDRQRKKKFYNDIRQQIEFYLGDVNLSKERFFNNLIQESPYIDIDIILNCNKIKKFTSNPKDIVKALKKSEFLSVTEDGTKVYRTVPVKPIQNADECTIYVEDLPPETDHEWLRSVFQTYGNIVYVSVPRYKQSNKIKGFAFIQFDSPESANNALKAFRSVNSCLSSNISPNELCSVKAFEGEKEAESAERNKTDVEAAKIIPTKCETVEPVEESDEPQRKKRKKDKKEHESEPVTQSREESDTHKEDSGKENQTKSEDERLKHEGTDTENYTEEKHARKRKRKKKKNESVQTYGMQILSKQEWKKLRNKYLEEQRKKMHELKEQLRKARFNRENEQVEENVETPPEECRVKFTPGVIIKLKLDQPITNIKHFKSEVKRYANVEYIDACEDNLEAYFRCSSNEVANQVIALNKWPNMEILKGEEELQYWEKIKLDRKKKVDEKIRCKTRGKTKLIKKVEAAMVKHIKFPD